MRAWLLVSILALAACDRAKPIASEYPAETTAFDIKGGEGLPFIVGKDMRPVWNLEPGDEPRRLGHFDSKDQTGAKLSEEKLRGKVTMVSFFFTDCSGICPMTTGNLLEAQKKFLNDDRFEILSFSVSPDTDKPKKLAEFAKLRHISHRRWRLATGKKDEIYALARKSFNADTISPAENAKKKVTSKDFLHSENVFLLDGELRLRGVYNGMMRGSVQEMMADAEKLASAETGRVLK